MRLLLYGLNFAPELVGIGKYSGEMASWLADRDHSVRVVTAVPYYPEWRLHSGYRQRWYRETIGKVEVLRCPLFIPKTQSATGRMALLASFALASGTALLHEARRFRPDIVFTVEPAVSGLPAALAAARLLRCRSWLHVQDFEVDAALKLGFLPAPVHGSLAAFERRLMRGFDVVSTISDRMLERLNEFGVPPVRTALLRNWVDTDDIRPLKRPSLLRAELGIPEERIVALYAGNFGRKQGLEALAQAIHSGSDSKDIMFLFCGTGAAYDDLVAVGPRENIRILPLQPQSRLNEVLNMADIHLLPQHEAAADLVMPSKLAPMLASGRPAVVAASPTSEIALLVAGAGRVVAPGDGAAMISQVVSLAADRTLREQLGTVGRERAKQYFEKTTILFELEAKLRRLAGADLRGANEQAAVSTEDVAFDSPARSNDSTLS
jgi:colanic acid biosynthesis glycosyl transferase WcaI